MVLIITVINDILFLSILRSDYHFLRSVIVSVNLSSLGLLFFVFTDALALAVNYSNAFKKNEEMSVELRKLNDNLELIIEERTNELFFSKEKITQQKEELKKANKELKKISNIDPLTKLWNRRYFDKTLKNEWRRAYREKKYLALLFIDIDNFKDFNDYYGHKDGDDCLQKVSSVIKKCIKRAGEIVARYGEKNL